MLMSKWNIAQCHKGLNLVMCAAPPSPPFLPPAATETADIGCCEKLHSGSSKSPSLFPSLGLLRSIGHARRKNRRRQRKFCGQLEGLGKRVCPRLRGYRVTTKGANSRNLWPLPCSLLCFPPLAPWPEINQIVYEICSQN